MKIRKQVIYIYFLVILAVIFAACTPKNETQQQTHSSVTEEGFNAGFNSSGLPSNLPGQYDKILSGDFSELAGTWVDGYGSRRTLMAYGTFGEGNASGFRRDDNGFYTWNISFESGGAGVQLYPAGIEVNERIGQTDITKTRILIVSSGDSAYNPNEFYYFESGAHTAVVTSSSPYAKILTGDLSEFTGIWANRRGDVSVLKSDGCFYRGYRAYSFIKDGDSYRWSVSMDGDSIYVWLYPAGIEIMNNNGFFIQSDTAKVRIYTGSDAGDGVYYREGDISLPVPVELAPGTFINGYIEEGEDHWFKITITGSDFDFLVVETDSGTNTVLEAYTESYEYINANYIKQDQNAWVGINIWGVKKGTTYIIKLKSYNSGSYRILAAETVAFG